MKAIVFATRNAGKLRELRELVAPLGLEVRSAAELALPEVVEDGDTFAANALKKARSAAEATGLPALADDSGLEVDHLGGAPGVHSARYAGRNGDHVANNAKLLQALRGVPRADRTARFVCVLALVDPAGGTEITRGTCEGRIAEAPRGGSGFGYDPLFVLPERDQTMAELAPAEKNQISHRARALQSLRGLLVARYGR